MMTLVKHKALLVFLSALVLFSACIKKSDPAPEPPVTEPLTTAAVKTGDTLVIKGQNFSTVAAENTVQFNGVAGTVVSATATELKVIVPANATSGNITVTVHDKTTTVGTLVVSPLTLYCIKNDFSQITTVRQLMALDPSTGNESVVVALSDFANFKFNDIEYLAATNEVIGLVGDGNYTGRKLVKINVTTKQVTPLTLTPSDNINFNELLLDNNGDLYSIKIDWTDLNNVKQSLVKIDPKTGNSTIIKTFAYCDWESLAYHQASNTVIGLADDGTRILKVNLTSKDTSSVVLPGSNVADYRELVVVDGIRIFGYKGNYSDPSSAIADLTEINTFTGHETLVTHLSTNGKIHDNLVYLPQRKEIATIWDQTGLYRINVTNLTSSNKTLATQYITYGPITSN